MGDNNKYVVMVQRGSNACKSPVFVADTLEGASTELASAAARAALNGANFNTFCIVVVDCTPMDN